jgi:hypothetical protein
MEPWKLGQTLEEAQTGLREYAGMSFGLWLISKVISINLLRACAGLFLISPGTTGLHLWLCRSLACNLQKIL